MLPLIFYCLHSHERKFNHVSDALNYFILVKNLAKLFNIGWAQVNIDMTQFCLRTWPAFGIFRFALANRRDLQKNALERELKSTGVQPLRLRSMNCEKSCWIFHKLNINWCVVNFAKNAQKISMIFNSIGDVHQTYQCSIYLYQNVRKIV